MGIRVETQIRRPELLCPMCVEVCVTDFQYSHQ